MKNYDLIGAGSFKSYGKMVKNLLILIECFDHFDERWLMGGLNRSPFFF
ncbi:hypothetical protein MCR_0498 [Moraxella catarrhalis BBH18]|nr:hypothetical protein MCR_0498 [Moraxella catarrhalis BBH18]